MIPLRARLIARRHQDLVGAPLRSRRVGAGPLLPLFLTGIVVLIWLMLVLSPGESPALTIGFILFLALFMLGTYLFTIDARLVVCERGILLGRLVPGLPFSPTYVIAGREIDPRTVAVVTDGAKTAAELGMPFFFFQYKTFPGALGVHAVVFNGPWGADVEASRQPRHRRPVRKSLYLFSHRNATKIAEEILHAIGRDGAIPPGFAPHEGLRPIPVTGRREDAVAQIAGAWPPDGHR